MYVANPPISTLVEIMITLDITLFIKLIIFFTTRVTKIVKITATITTKHIINKLFIFILLNKFVFIVSIKEMKKSANLKSKD